MKWEIKWWQVIALIIIVAGVFLAVNTAHQQDEQLRRDLLIKATIAAEIVDPAMVEGLNGSESDLSSPAYLHLKEQLERVRASDPSVRFTYLLGQRPEGVFFFADSEPADSVDYSPPGQLYTEATPLILRVFSNKQPETAGPASDRWGTWVSAVVPITEKKTGGQVALFGMDVDARDWYYTIVKACVDVTLATLLLLVLVIIFGLTQRRNQREQQRLSASEDKFYRAFHTNPAMMAVTSCEDGRFVDVNASFQKKLGYSREEVIGKTALDIGLYRESGKRESILARLKEAGEVSDLDVKFFKKNRDLLEGSFSSSIIEIDGRPCLLSVVLDITERKQAAEALRESEQRMRALIKSMDDLLFVLDEGLVFREYYQPPGTSTLYVNPELFIGRHFDDVGFPEPSYSIIKNALIETSQTGTPARAEYYLEIQNITYWFDLHVTSIMGSNGTRNGLTCVVRDITERKRIEETLYRANQKLNVLSRLTRQDLTNHIFTLNSYLELAEQEAEGQNEILIPIQESKSAARSVNEIAQLTRDYQDLGVHPPAWQNVKLTMLFGLSHLSAPDIQHRIETENLEIFADPLLEKAFQGLIENSLTHGEHVTQIRAWSEITPQGVTIFFEDDGVGIPKGKKERLFLHGDGPWTLSRGLLFIRDILEITGIAIHETGQPGKGARFEMTVPKGGYRISSEERP